MIVIKKIQLEKLQEFVDSHQFQLFENIPISSLRVASYLRNLNARSSDYVLYMAFFKDELVGYRTVLSDVFYIDNKSVSFGWLSGNWVDPAYRRKNISTKIFNEVYTDWKGRLMYSNYAEASKAVYDRTNKFKKLTTLYGYRYYYRSCLAQLLPAKSTFFKLVTPVLKLVDFIFNLFVKQKKRISPIQYSVNKIINWNRSHEEFLTIFKQNELFKRNKETYSWIINFPWLKSSTKTKEESKKYSFSLYAKQFNSNFYELKIDQKIIGIVHLSIRNKHLKLSYIYFVPKHLDTLVDFIKTKIVSHKINFATIYHKELNDKLVQQNNYLKKRVFKQHFFATKKVLNCFNVIKSVQTGDGDSVFT